MPRNHPLGTEVAALAERFEADEQAAAIDRSIERRSADRGSKARDRGIGEHNIHGLQLQCFHRVEGNVGRGLGAAENQPGIVLREVTLGYLDIKPNGECDRRGEYDQHEGPMIERK